ncbi:phosphotransferase [Pseudoduganella sp. UC29_106]|uniref:phosphotransferase n=1 Tax=Pseudoduganella sp. UC29_106 TaxID=3374553 RepID=UPI003756673B
MPQGVGVRVPPWAPDSGKSAAISNDRGVFLFARVISSATCRTTAALHQARPRRDRPRPGRRDAAPALAGAPRHGTGHPAFRTWARRSLADDGRTARLHKARARLDAGLVDEEDFDAERAGWSAARVWAEMTALLPLPPDPVVTHGDFSLNNLFLHHGEVAGCIDVGRAGVADRYQDLAILWNCLGEFGPSLQRRLFESYGIPRPDERRLRFHLMLDEFF